MCIVKTLTDYQSYKYFISLVKSNVIFPQAVTMSVLLYSLVSNKTLKDKLDGNYIRMFKAALNKSLKQQQENSSRTATCLPSHKLFK